MPSLWWPCLNLYSNSATTFLIDIINGLHPCIMFIIIVNQKQYISYVKINVFWHCQIKKIIKKHLCTLHSSLMWHWDKWFITFEDIPPISFHLSPPRHSGLVDYIHKSFRDSNWKTVEINWKGNSIQYFLSCITCFHCNFRWRLVRLKKIKNSKCRYRL